jgi:cyclase
MGAGELFLNVVDRDGTYKGYDLALLKKISEAVEIPVIMCGGASDMSDFEKAEQHGASAMAAGSMFVFRRPHNAVLISYI